MYCSAECIKKAYYVRNLGDKKSIYKNYDEFLKTQTGIGYKWEKEGAKILNAKHLEFNQSNPDLDWNGKKVDVKACEAYTAPNKSFQWVFNRNKQKPIDYFMCFCLKNNKPVKILLIPNKDFPKSGATVGNISRYDVFNIM